MELRPRTSFGILSKSACLPIRGLNRIHCTKLQLHTSAQRLCLQGVLDGDPTAYKDPQNQNTNHFGPLSHFMR